MNDPRLSVYFDGACHLCSREIEHYRKRDPQGRIHFVDISAPGFDAAAQGLDPVRVQKVMHVRLPSGELATGVQAFVEIWKALPEFARLAKLAQSPLVRPFLNGGYAMFAVIRPFLPRRKVDRCTDGTCAV